MKKAYLECLRKLKLFKKSLVEEIDKKRGKLYFTWLKDKTEKILNEKEGFLAYGIDFSESMIAEAKKDPQM